MTDSVIEADELRRIARPRLLDARDADAFAAGHPGGAIRVPVARWVEAAKADEALFSDLAFWEGEFADLGLAEDHVAVVYDDGRMIDAARVWFILQYFGARAVVLNGGWPALKKAPMTPATLGVTGGAAFRPREKAGSVGLVDRSGLKADLAKSAIFDSRTAAEYAGRDLRKNPRGGHLPGARLLPHGDLLDNGFLKPAEALRAMIAATGFQPGDHIVTHCDGGGRAALAAIAAIRAGFEDVNGYYLSFADWAKDESCPIVTPQ